MTDNNTGNDIKASLGFWRNLANKEHQEKAHEAFGGDHEQCQQYDAFGYRVFPYMMPPVIAKIGEEIANEIARGITSVFGNVYSMPGITGLIPDLPYKPLYVPPSTRRERFCSWLQIRREIAGRLCYRLVAGHAFWDEDEDGQ